MNAVVERWSDLSHNTQAIVVVCVAWPIVVALLLRAWDILVKRRGWS